MKFVIATMMFLGTVLAGCDSARTPAPAPATAEDAVCQPPMHECPRCNGDGYYCGMMCMDCPLPATPADDEVATLGTCGASVCGTGTYCCNTDCGTGPHCLPFGAACPAHTCD
jgi:hypothetical protein